MEVQLQELLDKIKNEGVKTAEQESARIRGQAELQARETLQKAHKEAEEIIARAKGEAARFEQTSREAVKQAARNTLLSVRKGLVQVFSALIEKETRSALSGQVLEEAVVALVKAWPQKQADKLEVLLAPQDLAKVESRLRSRLVEELQKGLELKPHPGLTAGFRIGLKDGSAYYDFTDRGIAQILAEYVNPRLAELISQAAGQEG